MSKKLTFVLNFGLVLALVLAMLPVSSAMASTPGDGFKLVFPKNGENCAPFAKVVVLGRVPGATVEYTFFTWGTGRQIKIGTMTAPLGEVVRFEYPNGIGDGKFSVAAAVYDEAGNLLWKKGGKWTIWCQKTR